MPKMTFHLQIGDRDILLREGELTFGRSEECTVLLDDALLSRVHARLDVSSEEVVLEDLGSKNGTYVNGTRLEEPSRLLNGDEIRLGRTVMKLSVLRRRTSTSQSKTPTLGFNTQVDSAPHGIDPTDVLFRMLQMGRLEEAEKLIRGRVSALTSQEEPPGVSHFMSRNVQEGLLALAERTMDGIWLHRLFALHSRCGWFMDDDVQQKAQQLIRAVGHVGGDGLVAYMAHWSARASELSTQRKHQLDRLRELASRPSSDPKLRPV